LVCKNAAPRNASISVIPSVWKFLPTLSSDREKYSIEERIAPLVFEMQCLGVVEPCWPCEGHNGQDEKLWKRPDVWFYCDDVIHLRLLTDAIEGLYVARKLNFQ
jgi:hypothetical protein